MSALPIWKCEFQPDSAAPATPLDNLTVGAPFKMNCRGDIEVQWVKDFPVELVFPKKEDSYTLYVLKTESLAANEAQFLVTAYKAGEHKLEYVRVVQRQGPGAADAADAAHLGFEMAKPEWTVKSVLNPNGKNEPVPPFGPWSISLPMWMILAVVLALCAVAYFGVRKLRKVNQRNKMLAELEHHKTALSPLHQYYRDARNLRRRLHNVKQVEELGELSRDLNREFRLYVLRQFLIPTLDWSDGQIVRDLRRRHKKVYNAAGDHLRKTLRELTRLQVMQPVLFKDVEQMQRMSLEAVEKIDRATLQTKGGGH